MLRRLGSTGASLTAVAAWTWTRPRLGSETECQQSGGVHALGRTCRVREPGQDFPVAAHHHGKAKVRVLKVRHDASGGAAGGEKHSVSEYTVHTRLYSPEYEKVFTQDDNSDLVATDTQKNTVYVVAKRTSASTPEQFGLDLAKHFLDTYPILSATQIEVEETLWERVVVNGKPHDHAFVKKSPEKACAVVKMGRGAGMTSVESQIRSMTVLKTTQSGFVGYHKDDLTLLPECADRCVATELEAKWGYADPGHVDFAKARASVREQLLKGIFGPPAGGVFSASLQATIYDAACLALTAVPQLAKINISTPNLHYLPTSQQLARLKVVEDGEAVRDVFIPTSEPSGTIFVEVKR
mmetsp:Transcript_10071/g.23216  ORF Transcript_10071/g.23216 Transcript_10071/m.23216 type:complete len:353 (-) Transcript_10071:288-1346(-)|eukprot:CAMPEP_0172618608 /NCGR_PEP_ID=MMETSP1068-20121228/83192_1 /TAXON_ID=35684 /ORGANISM="Pseudopedinella elastica, Strain CCMP716" /LENGTH=352 /DNA_ID=CAMNT_0013424939 /DNA_START=144 /DNA_END=1202 /DNA_ORIENTATION=+